MPLTQIITKTIGAELAGLVRAETSFDPTYAAHVEMLFARPQAPDEAAIGALLPPGDRSHARKLVLAVDAFAIYLRRPYEGGLDNVLKLVAEYEAGGGL